jgi:hypothetical protein
MPLSDAAIRRHMTGMNNQPLDPYRWQDHVIPPWRAAPSLVASALTVLAVAAAVFFAGPDPTAARPAGAAHISVERTPSLAQSAKRRVTPRRTEDWL